MGNLVRRFFMQSFRLSFKVSLTKYLTVLLAIVVVLILSIVTSSCSCSRTQDHQEYLSRLARVLDLKKPTIAQTHLRFPEKRNLERHSQQNTISIKAFLGLRNCQLHLALAKRNSLLGRVATPSQRLFNDLDILHSGPKCLPKIEDIELKNKLSFYLDAKRKDLLQTVADAVLAQNEYRSFWRTIPASVDYPDYLPSDTVSEDLSLINTLVLKLLKGNFFVSDQESKAIEKALGRLMHGDAGQLYYELMTYHAVLEAANTLIEQRLQQKLCLKQKPTQQARYFQNVINVFFIDKIQTKMVSLSTRYQQIMPMIRTLENELLPQADQQLIDWAKTRDIQLSNALASPKKHALLIQQLYNQCGLQSGNKINKAQS